MDRRASFTGLPCCSKSRTTISRLSSAILRADTATCGVLTRSIEKRLPRSPACDGLERDEGLIDARAERGDAPFAPVARCPAIA
jgi:hypothetical protein